MRHLSIVAVTVALLAGAASSLAADWTQYRGPNHNGISDEKIDFPWPAAGPKLVWKVPTPNGFSSFVTGGGQVYTLVTRNEGGSAREVCVALKDSDGSEVWASATSAAQYEPSGGDAGAPGNSGGDGPRSTPTFDDGQVYVFTQNLVLVCFDAKSGKQVWRHDLVAENAGRNIAWDNAASPVIDGDLVYAAAGGPGQSFLALNKKTGDVVWKTGTDAITHSTPTIANILGQRQVIFFAQSGLMSLDTLTGKLLWHYKFPYSTSTAISPVVCDDIVYCSAGYDMGAGACRISREGDGFAAKQVFRVPGNKNLANHWSTPIFYGGNLYGMFSFKKFGNGPMKCVEAATGKILWQQPGFGAGNVTLVGDHLVALTDDGQVVIVEASPKGYKEVCRTKAIEGKCWSTPAIANGKLYVRSTKEAACFDLTAK